MEPEDKEVEHAEQETDGERTHAEESSVYWNQLLRDALRERESNKRTTRRSWLTYLVLATVITVAAATTVYLAYERLTELNQSIGELRAEIETLKALEQEIAQLGVRAAALKQQDEALAKALGTEKSQVKGLDDQIKSAQDQLDKLNGGDFNQRLQKLEKVRDEPFNDKAFMRAIDRGLQKRWTTKQKSKSLIVTIRGEIAKKQDTKTLKSDVDKALAGELHHADGLPTLTGRLNHEIAHLKSSRTPEGIDQALGHLYPGSPDKLTSVVSGLDKVISGKQEKRSAEDLDEELGTLLGEESLTAYVKELAQKIEPPPTETDGGIDDGG